MLTKITDNFYIDFSDISCIEKEGKEIILIFKNDTNNHSINSMTKEGKEFIKALDQWLYNP